MPVRRSALALAAVFVLITAGEALAGGATIIVRNVSAAGVGFNDPTPAAPVGGNTGTTLGEQRLIAFEHAAKLWGQTIDSNVTIRVDARFRALNTSSGLHWHEMTTAERAASAIKFGRLIWEGANVTAGVPSMLVLGSPEVRVAEPAAIAGTLQFGTAAFGPPIGSPNVSAMVVAAEDAADAAGPASTDGCSPFTNAAAVAGKIALVERGTCGFALKARNATDAGAAAAIIYNNAANAAAAPPGWPPTRSTVRS
jgi:PA domain